MRLRMIQLVGLFVLATAAHAEGTLFLQRTGMTHQTDDHMSHLLVRETLRQFVWSIAWQDLNWVVRDEVLHETLRPGDDHWDIVSQGISGQIIWFELRQKQGETWVARGRFEVPAPQTYARLVPELATALMPHRAGIREVLRTHGRGLTQPRKPLAEEQAALLATQLERPNLMDQFLVTRELSSVAHPQPDTLQALARSYAQLHALAERRVRAAQFAFGARALLLAEEAVDNHPDDPTAYETRALVRSILGLHARAIDDLDSARALQRSMESRPLWSMARAISGFDLEGLQALAEAHPEQRAWALVMASRMAFIPDDQIRTIAFALDASVEAPACVRVYEDRIEARGISNLRFSTGAAVGALTRQLAAMRHYDGWPAAVEELVQGEPEEADLRFAGHCGGEFGLADPDGIARLRRLPTLEKALREADDAGTPGWATLGGLLCDTSFSLMQYRLWMLKEMLAVEVEDASRCALQLCSNHPYRAYLRTFAAETAQEWDAHLDQITFVDVHYGLGLLFDQLRGGSENARKLRARLTSYAWYHAGPVQGDVRQQTLRMRPPRNVEFSRTAQQISPSDPMIAVTRIGCAWPSVARHAETLAETHRQHPVVLRMMAERLYTNGMLPAATKMARRAIAAGPDFSSYAILVSVHLRNDAPLEAARVVEEYTRQPDPGLRHAQLRRMLQNWYLVRGQYQKALPFALENAETYASVDLANAALCYEGLGDYEQANAYWAANTRRYPNRCSDWLFWCIRVGAGDRASAMQATRPWIDVHAGELGTSHNQIFAGVTYTACGLPKKAEPWFRQALERFHQPSGGLHLAVTRLQLGDRAGAIAALRAVQKDGHLYIEKHTGFARDVLIELAVAGADLLEKGRRISDDQLRRWARVGEAFERANVAYFAGMLLHHGGDTKRAERLLRQAAEDSEGAKWTVMLARKELAARGVQVRRVLPHTFTTEWEPQ